MVRVIAICNFSPIADAIVVAVATSRFSSFCTRSRFGGAFTFVISGGSGRRCLDDGSGFCKCQGLVGVLGELESWRAGGTFHPEIEGMDPVKDP